jgi:hypothetical protein
LDYKYSVERSDQTLSHYSFERKKLFFHLFDLVIVNAQIYITYQARKIQRWEFSTKKSPKDSGSDGTEIQVQDKTSSPACRFIVRDHSIYSIPVTHAKKAEKSQFSFLVSAKKVVSDPESCEDTLQRTAENAMYDFTLGGILN